MKKLKYLPCPWCGSQPYEFMEGDVWCGNDKCQSRKRTRMTRDEWNTRYQEKAVEIASVDLVDVNANTKGTATVFVRYKDYSPYLSVEQDGIVLFSLYLSILVMHGWYTNGWYLTNDLYIKDPSELLDKLFSHMRFTQEVRP